jgi:hypothetical protein
MNRKLTSSRPLRISRHRLECGASPRFRILDGSWLVSKSARTRELSMNRPLVAQICNLLYRRIAFCGRHKPSTGSWSQCMMLESLELPMNRPRCRCSVCERSEPNSIAPEGLKIVARGKRSAAPGNATHLNCPLSPWWPSARTGESVAEGRVRGTRFMVPMYAPRKESSL